MWSALFLTLPTQPSAVRLRVWRALKALGCVALRDGVHLLPRSEGARFDPLVEQVRLHGGQALVFDLSTEDMERQAEVRALFDRAEAYGEWRAEAQGLTSALSTLDETEARRRFRSLSEALQALLRIDYYAAAAAEQAQDELEILRRAVDGHFSRGEPTALAAHGIARLDPRKFQGKCWVTRARPWVDRLASAWLIRRFIDPQARFVWLTDPPAATPVPRGALGFDYDGARFTHVGPRVTFEVLAARFGLDADPQLQSIARSVRFLDTGGIPVAEAAGLEAVLAGLRELHRDDDRLVAAASTVFDALYARHTASPP